jgi:hypothetical protein
LAQEGNELFGRDWDIIADQAILIQVMSGIYDIMGRLLYGIEAFAL